MAVEGGPSREEFDGLRLEHTELEHHFVLRKFSTGLIRNDVQHAAGTTSFPIRPVDHRNLEALAGHRSPRLVRNEVSSSK